VYVWTASVLLAAVCAAWRPVGGDVYTHTGVAAAVHAALQIAGLLFIVQAVVRIDALELAGIRGATTRAGLQVDGVYRVVRHPVYLGWVLIVFGAAHLTGDRLTFAIVTTLYLVVAVPWEERALLQSFGGAYAAYQRQVRWRIVPYVY